MNDYSKLRCAKAIVILAEETGCTIDEIIDDLTGLAWDEELASEILDSTWQIDDPDD